jgi:hypothetical protein
VAIEAHTPSPLRPSPDVASLAAKMNQIMISSADIAAKAPFDPIKITGGVLADEAAPLLAR